MEQLYKHLLEKEGRLVESGENFHFTLPVFELEGQKIGPLVLLMRRDCYINAQYWDLRVGSAPEGNENRAALGDCHPHVDRWNGRISWGFKWFGKEFNAQTETDPYKYLFMTVQFLRLDYHPNGSYLRIDQWDLDPQAS
jgi:hypothetical protein